MSDFSFIEIGSAAIVLFAVIDIIGSIPIIIDIKKKAGGDIDAAKASIVSMVIMLLFLVLGKSLLNLFGVDVQSFAVAGSFVIFFIALEMVLGINIFKQEENMGKTASIVPLAFPLIAGAGSMTTIISLKAEYHTINIAFAIVLNIVIIYIVLRLTKKIEQLLGEGGIAVLKKAFGVILLAISVKLFTSNAKSLLFDDYLTLFSS